MKVTIKGIIKENREELVIDKIVEFLLGDTTYQVYHKFMGEIVCKIECPLYTTDWKYTQLEIETYLNELKETIEYSWPISSEEYNYIDRNYGITDETIIKKIYLKYHIILFTKIINEFNDYGKTWNSINESLDNREQLLVDKISQYMLEDTEVEVNKRYERVYINYPSEGSNSYTPEKVLPLLLRRGYDINFVNYVQNTYSIKDWNLIVNISQRYYSLLYDKVKEMLGSSNNFMNESVEKKEEVVNRIVDYMIEDTKWEIYNEEGDTYTILQVKILYPSGDVDSYGVEDMMDDWDEFHSNYDDKQYVRNQFGINDEKTIERLYIRYINKLRHIILKEMNEFNYL